MAFRIVCSILFAMSALQGIWDPPQKADTAKGLRGLFQKVEADRDAQVERERSPRRKGGVKAMLLAWASGDSSAIGIWRLCHGICTVDGTNAGRGMARLAALASERSGSVQNCHKNLMTLMADTALVEMIEKVPHEPGLTTLTHHLRPSALIKLIHRHNRRRWGRIFSANKELLKDFWTDLFAQPDGEDFKNLHPILRGKTPEELQTTIPIIVHEDAAPYGKKRGVQLLQWGPLIYQGSDIESRFVAHGYIAKEGDTADTARKGWE